MWGALVLVTVVGCAPQMSPERSRWPGHRKLEEGRITELEKQVKELSVRLAALEGHRVPVAAVAPALPPLPPVLDKAMAKAGLEPIDAAVRACGANVPTKGTVNVWVKVDPAGHAVAVTIIDTPDKLVGECVANVVAGASFAKTQQGGSFSYPFVF